MESSGSGNIFGQNAGGGAGAGGDAIFGQAGRSGMMGGGLGLGLNNNRDRFMKNKNAFNAGTGGNV